MFDLDPRRILLTLPGIIIGLVFHEFSHAYMSHRLGDPTPKNFGRLTLSPRAHIDVIGFILIMLVGFGWAKPVQINPRYYKNPRRDEILVSVAGPAMNLFIAFLFAFIAWVFQTILTSGLIPVWNSNFIDVFGDLISYTIWINIVLFLFNLLPIPPLDGYHVFFNLFRVTNYRLIQTLEQYGSIILIILIITNATSYIIGRPALFIFQNIIQIFNI